MIILNKLIAFFLLASPIDENGWVSVERPKKNPLEEEQEKDKSIWPVFSRQFGSERVLVRFPQDPAYRYPALEQGGRQSMEIEAKSEGVFYRLTVLQRPDQTFDSLVKTKIEYIEAEEKAVLVQGEQTSAQTADLLYRSDKKWVRERLIMTAEHLYILQTANETLGEDSHLQFIASFDLEIRDANKVFHRIFESRSV